MGREFRRFVVVGCACVIFSRLTVEEIDRCRKFHPEALKILDENHKEIFRIELDDEGNPGCIEKNRIVFSRTKVPDGRATVTLVIDPAAEDKLGLVHKHFDTALLHLQELEEQPIFARTI